MMNKLRTQELPVSELLRRKYPLDRETINDDNGRKQVNELDYEIIVPLDQPTIGCRICAIRGSTLEFLNVKSLSSHLEKQHPRIRAVWKCKRCNKSFGRLHGMQCHYPKCKGGVN